MSYTNTNNQENKNINSLEYKQQYLRTEIPQQKYEDFYEFCEQFVGNVDINSWTFPQVKQIVAKFSQKSKAEQLKNQNDHKYTFHQYQTRSNAKLQQISRQEQESQYEEVSQCQSSKVIKRSAVDLLDSVMKQTQNQDTGSDQNRGRKMSQGFIDKKNGNSYGSTNGQKIKNNQFDEWTSSVGGTTQRAKKTSQHEKKFTFSYDPPSTSNKLFSSNDFNQSSKRQIKTQSNEIKSSDFDIFNPNPGVKKSPYVKKQSIKEPYESKKSTIRLKQIKPFYEATSMKTLPSSSSTIKNSALSSNLAGNQEKFQATIQCYKSAERKKLNDQNLNAFIQKHEIVERKFLAADYAMYNVKFSPQNIQCKRNYDDFVKLKANLSKFFPGVSLPYLEQKSWLPGAGTNQVFLNNQKKMLQFFTRDLLRNKQIRNSRIMEDFITLKDHKAIKRKFQKYDKMEAPKSLEQLCLIGGEVKCVINPKQRTYNENLQRLIVKISSLIDRQEKITQSLCQHYNEIGKGFKNLSLLMSEIERQIKQFNSRSGEEKIKFIEKSTKLLKETYLDQLANAQFDYELLSLKVLPFIKYERKNLLEFTKLIELQKRFRRSYDKRSSTPASSLNGNTNSNKRSIIEQSSNIAVLKHQTGYISHQMKIQGNRILQDYGLKVFQKFQGLGSSCMSRLTSSQKFWQNVGKMNLYKQIADQGQMVF